MNFWHMQLHPNDREWNKEEELLNIKALIGLGKWDEPDSKQQSMFEKLMNRGDVVAIKRGGDLVALVEVIGDYEYTDHIGDLDWFPRRRQVRMLDWYKSEYNYYISPRGTLTRCNMDSDAASNLSILSWYKRVNFQKDMQAIINILELKKQIILQGPPGTGKTYTAKDIAEKMIFGSISSNKKDQKYKLESSDQFKLVQFHPSYSYEDFIRGISAKLNGSQVEYKTENKTLTAFAADAQKNLDDQGKDKQLLSKEKWILEEVKKFGEMIQDTIDKEEKYPINETVSILEVEDDAFRYIGNEWNLNNKQRIRFTDIVLAYSENAQSRQDIKKISGMSGRAKQHSSYDFKLLEKFRAFLGTRPPFVAQDIQISLRKYILIIDEINRANLPSVLGELIYALEYRGESITSMYDLDGNRNIVLPPNLYIIGTMNTADRSVGHIDYAIRRRFSFVDVLPSATSIHPLAVNLFKRVSDLFIKNYDSIDWSNPALERSEYLASDFRPEDIWMGHSYFISNKENEQEAKEELKLKLYFEILPLLNEYLKDGILTEKASYKIKEIKNIGI